MGGRRSANRRYGAAARKTARPVLAVSKYFARARYRARKARAARTKDFRRARTPDGAIALPRRRITSPASYPRFMRGRPRSSGSFWSLPIARVAPARLIDSRRAGFFRAGALRMRVRCAGGRGWARVKFNLSELFDYRRVFVFQYFVRAGEELY